MLCDHMRCAYRLHAFLKEHPIFGVLKTPVFYTVGQINANDYVIQLHVYSTNGKSLGGKERRIPGTESMRCFAVLDDNFSKVHEDVPIQVEDLDYVVLFKESVSLVPNRPSNTTALVAQRHHVYVDPLQIAETLIAGLKEHVPDATTPAMTLLRQCHPEPVWQIDQWGILNVFHGIRQRLAELQRFVVFPVFRPTRPASRRMREKFLRQYVRS